MEARQKLKTLLDQLNTVIVGKPSQVSDCVACLLAGGHLLIEDVPGVGKTTLAHALARAFGLQFSRVQFTADLMPSDLSGVAVYDRGQRKPSSSIPGPIFAQVLLADEINRASPKTQSALLEAMEEKQVTVEGETRASALAVLRDRDAEPARPAGHLRVARVAARPLPDAHLARLSGPRRRARAVLAGADRREMVASSCRQLLTAHRAARRCSSSVQAGARSRAAARTTCRTWWRRARSGRWFLQGLSPARRHRHACARPRRRRCWPAATTWRRTTCRPCFPQTVAHRLVPVGDAGRGAVEQVRAMVAAVPLP
jgi:MoxR-like ATPase